MDGAKQRAHLISNIDLYFTDQGQTGMTDSTRRVYRLRASGALDHLCANVPSPNGITLYPTE
jgi:gluconolactonase